MPRNAHYAGAPRTQNAEATLTMRMVSQRT